MALLEDAARTFGRVNDSDNIFQSSLHMLEETRTIRITGKNVDELDLQKISDLITEASQRSYVVKFKNLFKNGKKAKPESKKASAK